MGGKQPSGNRSDDRSALVEALGVDFGAELLNLALTHRSYAYENGGLEPNERLEFLGDAVLGLVITDHLYQAHPDLPEGQLAKLRASVVNMHALAGVARELGQGGLGQYVLLGRGEELTGGRDKASILADSLEAVLGAVYLQHGIDVTRTVIHRLFGSLLAEAPQLGAGLDWKTSLQELTAAAELGVPEYRVEEQGPDHRKEFSAYVAVAGDTLGEGTGRTKKDAEQKAAQTAWRSLSERLKDTAEDGSASDGLAQGEPSSDGGPGGAAGGEKSRGGSE